MRLIRPFCLALLSLALLVPAMGVVSLGIGSVGVAEAAPAAGRVAAKDVALVRALKKQRLKEIAFKETDLLGIVKWLRVATSKNIVIKRAALAKADIEWEDISYTVQLKDVSVWTFLESILLKPHGMSLKIKGNIVFLTSKADSYGKPVTKLYGISHITWTKTDFIGPEINLEPSGFTPAEEYEPEKIVEDDPLNNGEAVAELVKELLLPKGWENNDDWTIRATDRHLVIRAPKAVHQLILRTLQKIASMK